jgi:hypothetical protein
MYKAGGKFTFLNLLAQLLRLIVIEYAVQVS